MIYLQLFLSFLQIGALVSTDGRYDQTFLANYLDINVIPQIKRIEGVGDVMELGDTYSMRIWLKPERMAQYGLVPSDVTAVLGEQNIEAPTGSLGENSKNGFQFTMKYRGRLKSVEEFQNTVIRSQSDGSVLRLKDVADVQLGTMTYSFRSEMDSKPAVLYMVFQTAGSNATAVNKEITAQMKQMENVMKAAGVTQNSFVQTAADIRSNVEFMNQINQVYTYVQLPLKLSGQNASGDLYVYTNKKNLNDPEAELTAFLHLDLDNLGSTDVSIRMKDKNVKTNFYIADDASYDLIEKHLPVLEKRLAQKGYRCSITMSKEEKKVEFVEDFLQRDMPQAGTLHRYSFDVRA